MGERSVGHTDVFFSGGALRAQTLEVLQPTRRLDQGRGSKSVLRGCVGTNHVVSTHAAQIFLCACKKVPPGAPLSAMKGKAKATHTWTVFQIFFQPSSFSFYFFLQSKA